MSRRVRRSYGVVALFEGGRLELLGPVSGSRIPAAAWAVGALGACAAWTAMEEMPLEAAGVEYLLRAGLLVEEGTSAAALDESIREWEPWGQETVCYQFRARRFFVDHPAVEAGAPQAGCPGPPPIVKRYPGAERIELPLPARVSADFARALRCRRTWREFSARPLPLAPFATLLGLALGATGTADAGPFGEVLLRTSPSAGARHPVEAYVCALNVEGIPPGVYHYAVLEHALERLEIAAGPAEVVAQMDQPCFLGAAFVCLLTAVVERSRWKYPFGRMYRTMLLDLGHIAQTFTLTATALGLASFQTAAFKEPPIEEMLGRNPAAEPLLHAVGAGLPPRGGAALFKDAHPEAPDRRVRGQACS